MKNYHILLIASAFTIFFSCKSNLPQQKNAIQVQAHRGDRGYFPENTLPAFYSAIDKGADVIELDLVISKDKKVVVSHDTFMHSAYISWPNGNPVTKDEEKKSNLYQMKYDSIRSFDAGFRTNPAFPDQKSVKTYKPLLSEMIDSIENYIVKNNKQRIRYNIESNRVREITESSNLNLKNLWIWFYKSSKKRKLRSIATCSLLTQIF